MKKLTIDNYHDLKAGMILNLNGIDAKITRVTFRKRGPNQIFFSGKNLRGNSLELIGSNFDSDLLNADVYIR